jgi:hypothetical protein
MAKRLVVHAGFFKTGTTALQTSFAHHREELLSHNILYPKLGATGQHRAAWALSGRHWGWENQGGQVTRRSVWENTIKELNTYPDTALLSSEFLAELLPEHIESMKRDIKADEITIVFTIRPLVKMLSSQYQQSLKYGMRLDYLGWLDRVLNDKTDAVQNQTFWRRHHHPEVIKRWVKVFGAENIVVIVGDETEPEFIFKSFNDEVLSLSKRILTQIPETGLNRSLTWPEIQLLIEINKQYDREKGWDEYTTMVRNGIFRNLANTPANPEDERMLTPHWAIQKSQAIATKFVSQIRDLEVRVIGNLEGIASATVAEGENKPTNGMNFHDVAKVVLMHSQAEILSEIPGQDVRREFVKRMKKSHNPVLRTGLRLYGLIRRIR